MKAYLSLSVDLIPEYFNSRLANHLPIKLRKLRSVELVTQYSNNNYLFKLGVGSNQSQQFLYLKQAQRYNRRSVLRGRPQYVAPQRIEGEVDVLRQLRKIWGPNVVPEVLYYEKKFFALIMNDVSSNKLLIDEFTDRHTHPEIATRMAILFGQLHSSTWGTNKQYITSKSWYKVLTKFLTTHYATGVKKFVSLDKVNKFCNSSLQHRHCLIWGDPVYRNIFVKPKGQVTFIDFDMALRGDPAFDVGLLISHWLWMLLHRSAGVRRGARQFIKTFFPIYRKNMLTRISQDEYSKLLYRTGKHAGLYLVSRTDGDSGSYFADWPAWESQIRKLGLEMFKEYITLADLQK
ncbi:aminoglycoside phosphotransferase family protein [Patescibacteria group bacterium]